MDLPILFISCKCIWCLALRYIPKEIENMFLTKIFTLMFISYIIHYNQKVESNCYQLKNGWIKKMVYPCDEKEMKYMKYCGSKDKGQAAMRQ